MLLKLGEFAVVRGFLRVWYSFLEAGEEINRQDPLLEEGFRDISAYLLDPASSAIYL